MLSFCKSELILPFVLLLQLFRWAPLHLFICETLVLPNFLTLTLTELMNTTGIHNCDEKYHTVWSTHTSKMCLRQQLRKKDFPQYLTCNMQGLSMSRTWHNLWACCFETREKLRSTMASSFRYTHTLIQRVQTDGMKTTLTNTNHYTPKSLQQVHLVCGMHNLAGEWEKKNDLRDRQSRAPEMV